MGHGTVTTKNTAVAVKVSFVNSQDWAFYQAYDPGFRQLLGGISEYPDNPERHSYEALSLRNQLALDLTRGAIGKYYADGFEKLDSNEYVPDVDIGFVRGGFTLTNTDPILVNLDKRGHFLLYIKNLIDVMHLKDKQFEQLREGTPQYRNLDRRDHDGRIPYFPKDGDAYQILP